MSKRFALIGVGGYIAPRHLGAIRHIGGDLLVAVDPKDSVGIMDSYFPQAEFFTEFERFDRHVDQLRRSGTAIDFTSICSPNYLHDPHSRFALRSGSDAICEKPITLTTDSIDELAELERQTGKRVLTILQLRLHDAIRALRDKVTAQPNKRFAVDLTYITSRGRWYYESWKGDEHKSGGVATNIGVHFFDMLTFVFGKVRLNEAHLREPARAAGFIECERADVRWFLSIDAADLPRGLDPAKRTFRSITMDGTEIEFSEGFTELHNRSYEEILAGRGFSLADVRPSIEIVSELRSMALKSRSSDRAHRMGAA
ncbi:Gfo/Idh/MocA family oxidoreductase [Bradyrhizobium sp.]|uniref:Gfo/Idh/MocA family oxidoreductase n=1 Tax=Bradyrhizobium sp. TaxID=376 RepID=UPI004037EA4F